MTDVINGTPLTADNGNRNTTNSRESNKSEKPIKTDSGFDVFLKGLKYVLNPVNLIRELTSWKPFEWGLMVTLTAVQTIVLIIGNDYSVTGWIGYVTGLFTIFSLLLVNKGRLTNYLWGFLGCSTWLVVSIQNRLIGDIFSQSFYVVMNVIGIYFWKKQMDSQSDSNDHVEAKKMTVLQSVLTIIGTIVLYAIVVTVSIHANGNQVWLDGALLPLGIAGQVLMTFGYRSQWVAWIAIDVLNVIIWGNQLATEGTAAMSMLVLQVVMLLNAFYGTWCWFHDTIGTEASKSTGKEQ